MCFYYPNKTRRSIVCVSVIVSVVDCCGEGPWSDCGMKLGTPDSIISVGMLELEAIQTILRVYN